MNIRYLKIRVDFLTARVEKLNQTVAGYEQGITPLKHTFQFACSNCAIKTTSVPHLHHHILTTHHGKTGAKRGRAENNYDYPELCTQIEKLLL